MSDKELKQALQEIKDYCQKRPMCEDCKFESRTGCTINNVPDKWNIDMIGMDKWHTLHSWLVDIRVAIDLDARKGLKEHTIDQARVKLLDNILEYMNKLDEEEHDET